MSLRICRFFKLSKTDMIVGILLASVLISACGCRLNNEQKTTSQNQQAKPLQVVTSFLPMYIFTANLIDGIPDVSLTNMAAPDTGCLHDYRLLPGDLIKLESADLFIINGAGMEGFMADLADQEDDLTIIEASRGIALLTDVNKTSNPHVWLSVKNAIRQVENISQGLQSADPAHAAAYAANERTYVAKLEKVEERYRTELAPLAGRRMITFHEAFPYLAAEYGLEIAAVIEREPGSEPTAAELAKTIELVLNEQIKALFAEPQYPVKVAETIARETGATVYTLDPIVTGKADKDTYALVMENNLQILVQALQ